MSDTRAFSRPFLFFQIVCSVHWRRYFGAMSNAVHAPCLVAGALLALSDKDASAEDLLERLSGVLDAAAAVPRPWDEGAPESARELGADVGSCPARKPEEAWLPPPRPAEPGSVRCAFGATH